MDVAVAIAKMMLEDLLACYLKFVIVFIQLQGRNNVSGETNFIVADRLKCMVGSINAVNARFVAKNIRQDGPSREGIALAVVGRWPDTRLHEGINNALRASCPTWGNRFSADD